MTSRIIKLPPQARSIILREIGSHRLSGVVVLSALFEAVRAICPDAISDRAVEEAIVEEAVSAGLAVHLDQQSGERRDAPEGA